MAILKARAAKKSAKRAKRAERLNQFFIQRQLQAQSKSLREQARRQLGLARAQFGAAGVAVEGSTGDVSEQGLLDTVEEISFLQDASLLNLIASRNRQKAASDAERAGDAATVSSIVSAVLSFGTDTGNAINTFKNTPTTTPAADAAGVSGAAAGGQVGAAAGASTGVVVL